MVTPFRFSAVRDSRESRPHEPMQSLRCFAAMEESQSFVPTTDVLLNTSVLPASTEATASVSSPGRTLVFFVIGRGPSQEVEQSTLSRVTNTFPAPLAMRAL